VSQITEKSLLLNPNSIDRNTDCFLSTTCLHETPVSSPHKLLAHNTALVKTRDYKTVYMAKWIHSPESGFYLEFLA